METLNNWNLSLTDDLVQIKGRVLDQQKIYSNSKIYESGVEADWTKYIRALPMFMSATMNQWAVVFPDFSQQNVKTFIKTVIQVAGNMSLRLPLPFL